MNFENSGPPALSLASPVRGTEDSTYVAVGRDLDNYKSILSYAIQHSGGNMIYILYVHRPAKFPIMSMIKKGRWETERQRLDDILEKFHCICREYKVQANIVHTEEKCIKRGIVDLITQHGVRNLVMGAAADKHYKEDMKAPTSRKAVYVSANAPPSCQIRFICRGNLVATREAHNVTGHSTVNNGRSINDIEPSSMRLLADEYGCDDSEGSLRTSFRVSGCSSVIKTIFDETLASPSNELCALSPASGYLKSRLASPLIQPSLMLPSSDKYLDGTFYGELHEARADIERRTNLSLEAERENFKKALRTAQEETEQRKKIEEVLVRERAELEQVNNQRDQMMEEVRIAKEEKTLLESQNEEVKKKRDELQIELDKALKEAEELRRKQAEDSRHVPEFLLSEIKEATQGFNISLRIGTGGYGNVYKGLLRQNDVAIKMLQPDSQQGPAEFRKEVHVLSQLRHPNIVRLIGYCSEASVLIYEYLPNGSLEDWLKCKNKRPPLPLQTRIRIAIELCSVLVYLHSREPHSIVHADLKPDNILLDANFESKLGDFGMCRILCREISSNDTTLCHYTIPKGTVPYIDPEFFVSGKLTRNSDVYSFGIILLRLLTGKPAFGVANEVQAVLDAGNLKSLLDPLAGDWPFEPVQELVHMALRCCDSNPKNRPDLESDVMILLERTRASCVAYASSGLQD